MKTLLAILILSNLVVLWFCVLKDNVHFTFGKKPLPDAEEAEDSPKEHEDEPIVIRLSDLKAKVKEYVHEEYMELLNEKDAVVEPTQKEIALNKEQMEQAFANDVKTDSVAEGQTAAASSSDDDDESVPSFGQLDASMRAIGNPRTTPAERRIAVETAMTITDTDIIVTLPEPLHSRFRDAVAEYQAQQIEKEASEPEYKVIKIISQPRQALPDNPENFNIRDYKRY